MDPKTDLVLPTSEDDAVIEWRTKRLHDAGFDGATASELASHRGFDLHALLELVDRGCPPAFAARIVHPLD